MITGASRGIGCAAASALADDGWNVIALSRTPCPDERVRSIPCDITCGDQVRGAFSQIGRVDLLINNAGFGISGAVEFTRPEELRAQFDLNVFAQVGVIQAALPRLKESRGRILCITSAAAVFPIPFQSFYSATKASMESVSRALGNELRPFGVQVCAVRLGDVKTGFTAARRKSGEGDDVYGGAIARSLAVMEHDEQNGMAPQTVAKAIIRLLSRRKLPVVATVGVQYQLLCLLNRLLPIALVNRLLEMIYIPKK